MSKKLVHLLLLASHAEALKIVSEMQSEGSNEYKQYMQQSPFYLRNHPEQRHSGDIADIKSLSQFQAQNSLDGVENVFEKNAKGFEKLVQGAGNAGSTQQKSARAAFSSLPRDTAGADHVFLGVESGETQLADLKSKLKAHLRQRTKEEEEEQLEWEKTKLSEQQKNANKLSQLEHTINAMKSKINNLESLKDGESSFVQLSSDVANLKINSFKDMARGLESSVDKPEDQTFAETNEDSDSDQDDEEEDSTSFYTTATSSKRTKKGRGLAQKQSTLDSQDEEQEELENQAKSGDNEEEESEDQFKKSTRPEHLSSPSAQEQYEENMLRESKDPAKIKENEAKEKAEKQADENQRRKEAEIQNQQQDSGAKKQNKKKDSQIYENKPVKMHEDGEALKDSFPKEKQSKTEGSLEIEDKPDLVKRTNKPDLQKQKEQEIKAQEQQKKAQEQEKKVKKQEKKQKEQEKKDQKAQQKEQEANKTVKGLEDLRDVVRKGYDERKSIEKKYEQEKEEKKNKKVVVNNDSDASDDEDEKDNKDQKSKESKEDQKKESQKEEKQDKTKEDDNENDDDHIKKLEQQLKEAKDKKKDSKEGEDQPTNNNQHLKQEKSNKKQKVEQESDQSDDDDEEQKPVKIIETKQKDDDKETIKEEVSNQLRKETIKQEVSKQLKQQKGDDKEQEKPIKSIQVKGSRIDIFDSNKEDKEPIVDDDFGQEKESGSSKKKEKKTAKKPQSQKEQKKALVQSLKQNKKAVQELDFEDKSMALLDDQVVLPESIPSLDKHKLAIQNAEDAKELKTIGFADVSDLEQEALTMDPEENKRRMELLQKQRAAEDLFRQAQAKTKREKEEAERKRQEEEERIKNLPPPLTLAEKKQQRKDAQDVKDKSDEEAFAIDLL